MSSTKAVQGKELAEFKNISRTSRSFSNEKEKSERNREIQNLNTHQSQ